jgi:glycine oxidase
MGSATPDVCVVGGGVMGSGIALRLAQAGLRVTVLERSIPGAEASSAAAGILAPQKEAAGPGPLLDLCLRSRALYPKFAQELLELSGVDVGYVPCGLLSAAFDEAGVHRLEATRAWQTALGLRAELLTAQEARGLEPGLSANAVGALHLPDDHQVDNQRLVRALTMATARAGVLFRTGNVRGLEVRDGRVVGVDLDGDRLAAGAVVVAAGSWSGLVHGTGLSPRVVRPVRGQMVELQARLPPFSRILFSTRGYLVPRPDGRVVAGSTMEQVGFEKEVTASGLHAILGMALELCPDLAPVPVARSWAGLRPDTEDHLPLLGPGPLPGLFLATGHFRNGILLAPVTARLLSEVVRGQKPSVDLRPFRCDRPQVVAPAADHPS